ncbi:hypothetical protein BCEN4_740032 [Burkholderia cenocepacia]|nr:hypothetical protein BCEN4_740032 [Burkholderia cenocepacia]
MPPLNTCSQCRLVYTLIYVYSTIKKNLYHFLIVVTDRVVKADNSNFFFVVVFFFAFLVPMGFVWCF